MPFNYIKRCFLASVFPQFASAIKPLSPRENGLRGYVDNVLTFSTLIVKLTSRFLCLCTLRWDLTEGIPAANVTFTVA